MAEFREVVALMRSGALHPVIDTVVAPDAASEAYARLESGDQFGKLWWIGGGESFAAKHDRPVYFCHGSFKAAQSVRPPTLPHLGLTDSRLKPCSTTTKHEFGHVIRTVARVCLLGLKRLSTGRVKPTNTAFC